MRIVSLAIAYVNTCRSSPGHLVPFGIDGRRNEGQASERRTSPLHGGEPLNALLDCVNAVLETEVRLARA